MFLVNSRHPLFCAPRHRLPGAGPPSPEVTGAFCRVPSTPFAHTPWYALPVHQCRFRVRSIRRRCFPEDPGRRRNPLSGDDVWPSSRPGRRRNVNPLPIGYGLRPRLRGPANPARINLAQEPLDFRRAGFSPALTLLMSAFALPMPPAPLARHLHRPTERSATAGRSLIGQPAASVRGLSPVTFSAPDG